MQAGNRPHRRGHPSPQTSVLWVGLGWVLYQMNKGGGSTSIAVEVGLADKGRARHEREEKWKEVGSSLPCGNVEDRVAALAQPQTRQLAHCTPHVAGERRRRLGRMRRKRKRGRSDIGSVVGEQQRVHSVEVSSHRCSRKDLDDLPRTPLSFILFRGGPHRGCFV